MKPERIAAWKTLMASGVWLPVKQLQIEINEEAVRDFCKRNRICRLAFFGSVLRDDFRADSDIDILIEFEQGYCVGLIRFARMANELEDMMGRHVDLATPAGLCPLFRDDVLRDAELFYVAA